MHYDDMTEAERKLCEEQPLDFSVIVQAKQLENSNPEKYEFSDKDDHLYLRVVDETYSGVKIAGYIFRRYIVRNEGSKTTEYMHYQNDLFVITVRREWNKFRGITYT
jgi:hypothetical protein